MDPSTRFDDDQIRRILTRAAERQEQTDRALPAAEDGSKAGNQPGLSLAELQSVAGEVGISASHVEAAAREIQLRPSGEVEQYRFIGIPKESSDFRVVPGTPGIRQWEQIVGLVRDEFRVPGVTNDFGDVREWWSSGQTTAGVRLRLAPGEAGTEVSIRRSNRTLSELTGVLTGTFLGMGGVAGVVAALAGATPKAWVGVAICGALSVMTWGIGILGARASVQKMDERFDRLLDRIELVIRSG